MRIDNPKTMNSESRKIKATAELQSTPSKLPKTPQKAPTMSLVRTSEKKKKERQRAKASKSTTENEVASQSVDNVTKDHDKEEDEEEEEMQTSKPLTPVKRNKGKERARPELDAADPVPTTSNEAKQSDSELSDIDFIPLEIEGKAAAASHNPHSLVRTFTNPPELYFKDHMAPFQGILKGVKAEPDPAKRAAEISRYVKGRSKSTILVATSGKEVTEDTKRTINVVIRVVTENKPENVVHIKKSSWCMVELMKREDMQVLLDQQVLFDPVKDRLVVFRKVALKPSLDRVFEVRNIRDRKSTRLNSSHI